MKVGIVVIGKTAKAYSAAVDDYLSRISHYLPVRLTVLPDVTKGKTLSIAQIKSLEGAQMMKLFGTTDYVVLLDEQGKEYSSVAFAQWLNRQQQRQLWFVIGGAYGFSDDLYARANEKLSLSQMTFPHDLVRLIFVEQLYRACTIIKGEPYHHE